MKNNLLIIFIKKEWWRILIYWTSIFCGGIIPLFLSMEITELINIILANKSADKMIIFVLIGIFMYALSVYLSQVYSVNLVASLKTKLINQKFNTIMRAYKNILNMNINNSELSQKIINESQNMADFYINITIRSLRAIVLLLILCFLLFQENIKLTFVLCIVVLIALVLLLRLNNQIFNRQQKVIALSANYFRNSESWIRNLEQIKLFALFEHVYHEILNNGKKLIEAVIHSFDIELCEMFIISALRYLFIALFILYSSSLSELNLGKVFLIISLLTQFFGYVDELKQFVITCQKFKASRYVLNSIESLGINEENQSKSIISRITNINISHLVGEKQKSHPLSLEMIPNNIYCVTGDNGIGKSTFFNMLLGIEKNYTGIIKINNEFIENINLEAMYNKSIIYMEQSSELIEYIDVPDGKIALSRGERQNYLLADQLQSTLQNSLILLDEPTASLDAQSKERFVVTVDKLKATNIIVIISHDSYILRQSYIEVRLD